MLGQEVLPEISIFRLVTSLRAFAAPAWRLCCRCSIRLHINYGPSPGCGPKCSWPEAILPSGGWKRKENAVI